MPLSLSDKSIIGAAFHGHTLELEKAGLVPEHLESDAARKVVAACLDCVHAGMPVNILNVMSFAKNLPEVEWLPVIEIGKNGYGDVSYQQALISAKTNYINRQFLQIWSDAGKLSKENPSGITEWLTVVSNRFDGLVRGNQNDSDGDFKEAGLNAKPYISFTSNSSQINRLLGGGYKAIFVLYIGVSGQGKSTINYMHACDGIKKQKRVLFWDNERGKEMVYIRVMEGLSALTVAEIVEKRGSTPEREAIRKAWEDYIQEYLRIYETPDYTEAVIERKIRWHKPDLVCIDYLKDEPGMLTRNRVYGRNDKADSIGDMSNTLMGLSRDYGVPIITAGQMANDAEVKFKQFDDFEVGAVYGTAKPKQHAQLVFNMKRNNHGYHDQLLGYFRCIKDYFGTQWQYVDRLPFNVHRQIFDLGVGDEPALPPL